jgi:D-erythrulose 1-phosphate 3-epimerase
MEFGVNLAIATKRMPEPEAWASFVRERLGLDLVQFSYDLLDPWWPAAVRDAQADRVRRAAAESGIRIHSAQIGFAGYSYNMLLGPDRDLRGVAEEWWRRAIDVAAAIGARAMGGPLGAMSLASAARPAEREARREELLETMVRLCDHAAASGLEALLVEPTPLRRELPSTLEEARAFVLDLEGRTAVPVVYVLDVGHAMYQPLYGARAPLEPWLDALASHLGVLHLQNTDFQSDSHWGWPDTRGRFDVGAFAHVIADRAIDVPVVLEVVHPFELDDDEMLEHVVSSVAHCREALDAADSP